MKLIFFLLISIFILKINCETINNNKIKINYFNSVSYISIYPNENSNDKYDLLCIVNLECMYNGQLQSFGANRMVKNLDGSGSCNSTFDFSGYTDFQAQECKGTQLYMISNKILNEKVSVSLSFPIVIDDFELHTNGSSSLKIRFYSGDGNTPISIRDITGQEREIKNLKYTNSHIFNVPGILSWTMDPGFGYVLISFGGEANAAGIPYKATYPKPIITSSKTIGIDLEQGITRIEFRGSNFGTNKKLLTFLPNCYPFPYKINIDYVNSTYLLISDYNKLKGLCPSRDFRYTICLDNFCGTGQLKEGYPPISIESIKGPTANRTYTFNGYFLNSTSYSQLTPVSQYGVRLSTSLTQIEFQMNSPTYYQYTGTRAFKFWDKNANTSISVAIPQPPSLIFEAGPPTLISTIELEDRLKVDGKFFTYDMTVLLDGTKLNASTVFIENATTFYVKPTPRPGILCIVDVGGVNSTIPISIKVSIKHITSPPTKGGLITITGTGLFLKSENTQPLKTILSIENFSNNINNATCTDLKEDIEQPGSVITCKVTPGIGSKLNFKLKIGGSPVAIYSNFTYQPPTIKSIVQSSDIALLNGNNLGENVKVYLYFNSGNNSMTNKPMITTLPVLTNTSESIQFSIPDNIKTSMVYIEVGGQRSNQVQLIIIPYITSIGNDKQIPITGGTITIFGKYLNLVNYNNDPIYNIHNNIVHDKDGGNLHIKIGDRLCKDVLQADDKRFTSISCKISPGSGGNYPISILINNTMVNGNPKSLTFSYMPPTILNATSVPPNTGGLITIFGSQLAKPINVTINQQPCIYINITNSNSLTCYLPPLSESLTSTSMKSNHPVQIIVNGQASTNVDIFKYTTPESYNYKNEDNDQNNNDKSDPNKVTWLIPAILIPCLFFLIAIIVLIVIYIKKYRKSKQIEKRLNEPIPPESSSSSSSSSNDSSSLPT